jgi:hypothetical protein
VVVLEVPAWSGNAFLVLDLGLDIVDGVRRLQARVHGKGPQIMVPAGNDDVVDGVRLGGFRLKGDPKKPKRASLWSSQSLTMQQSRSWP